MPPGACVSENCLDPPAGSRGSGAKKGSESGMTTTTKPMRGSAPNYDEILRVVHVVISRPAAGCASPSRLPTRMDGWSTSSSTLPTSWIDIAPVVSTRTPSTKRFFDKTTRALGPAAGPLGTAPYRLTAGMARHSP